MEQILLKDLSLANLEHFLPPIFREQIEDNLKCLENLIRVELQGYATIIGNTQLLDLSHTSKGQLCFMNCQFQFIPLKSKLQKKPDVIPQCENFGIDFKILIGMTLTTLKKRENILLVTSQ